MTSERHFGMDWLRVGAFALLILYHVGMVFVPWDFHVNSPVQVAWLETPMLALNPWRLCLLFLVSGFASRHLLAKLGSTGGFLRSRIARLGLPLLFGMAVIVPPQSWVELVVKHGYQGGFGAFWLDDYFRFGALDGIVMPTWNHLWFVVYLLAYTLVVAAVIALLPAPARAALQRGFDRVMGGWMLFVLPAALLLADRTFLYPVFKETHALVDDWAMHPIYLGCFLFGFALARSAPAWAMLRRHWLLAVLAALASGTAFLQLNRFLFIDGTNEALLMAARTARSVFTWTAILALIALADRYLDRDHRWRRTLTEAVFPFYIIHQTIIVVLAWRLFEAGFGNGAAFAILVAATAAGCWSFYLIGRKIGWLRPLIGLQRRARVSPAPASRSPAAA